jgi:hypothetical protein
VKQVGCGSTRTPRWRMDADCRSSPAVRTPALPGCRNHFRSRGPRVGQLGRRSAGCRHHSERQAAVMAARRRAARAARPAPRRAAADRRDAEGGSARRPDPGVAATEIDGDHRGFRRAGVDTGGCTRDMSGGGGDAGRAVDLSGPLRYANRGTHADIPSAWAQDVPVQDLPEPGSSRAGADLTSVGGGFGRRAPRPPRPDGASCRRSPRRRRQRVEAGGLVASSVRRHAGMAAAGRGAGGQGRRGRRRAPGW